MWVYHLPWSYPSHTGNNSFDVPMGNHCMLLSNGNQSSNQLENFCIVPSLRDSTHCVLERMSLICHLDLSIATVQCTPCPIKSPPNVLTYCYNVTAGKSSTIMRQFAPPSQPLLEEFYVKWGVNDSSTCRVCSWSQIQFCLVEEDAELFPSGCLYKNADICFVGNITKSGMLDFTVGRKPSYYAHIVLTFSVMLKNVRLGLHCEVNTYHAWFIYIEAASDWYKHWQATRTIHRLCTFMEIEVLWGMFL